MNNFGGHSGTPSAVPSGNAPERAKLNQLHKEIRAARDAFWREYERVRPTWNYGVGPVRLRAQVSSGFITHIYIVLNIGFFAAGIGFIVVGGNVLTSLGVALIVGVLFSFGAFIAQFWSVVQQREYETFDRIFGHADISRLKELGDKWIELTNRADRVDQSAHDSDPAS